LECIIRDDVNPISCHSKNGDAEREEFVGWCIPDILVG